VASCFHWTYIGEKMPDGITETGQETSRPFHLGVWLVEPMANRVSVGDTSVQLEQKVMAVLLCLAEHAGEAVTRQQLIDWVWDEGFVADNTITHAVAELRKSLGDCARKPRFIETIHRRGYRLIAPVRFDGAQPVMSSTPHPSFLAIARGVELPLYEGENLIGRAPDAVITIPSMKVSRHHAQITIEGETATLDDLGSKNGTFLNGTRVQQRVPLNGGDLVSIGCMTETIRVVDSLGGLTTEPDPDS
jgi:DNA-binding winged helix-turn-helix (wHTH) protein